MEKESQRNKEFDERMMRRAIEIARSASGLASPNPMVGAVIVSPDGKIVGEGFTSAWGGAHAEVNAVNSVRDKSILSQCDIYVTLEPCSHHGKTPPCAAMLARHKFRRCVVGIADPFAKVAGRGLKCMRDAGIEVEVGVLEKECRELNRRFITAHTHGRVYVILKWAQSADGFVAHADGSPANLSDAVGRVLVHRERSKVDAILVGSQTVINDNPQLDCRFWPNRLLRPVILDARNRIGDGANVNREETIFVRQPMSPQEIARMLYEREGLISLMVEGGPTTLASWIESGVFDEVRVEMSPVVLGEGLKAPALPELPYTYSRQGSSVIAHWLGQTLNANIGN